jgi:hypothetical protein
VREQLNREHHPVWNDGLDIFLEVGSAFVEQYCKAIWCGKLHTIFLLLLAGLFAVML